MRCDEQLDKHNSQQVEIIGKRADVREAKLGPKKVHYLVEKSDR